MNLNNLIRVNIFALRYNEIKFEMPLFQRALKSLSSLSLVILLFILIYPTLQIYGDKNIQRKYLYYRNYIII